MGCLSMRVFVCLCLPTWGYDNLKQAKVTRFFKPLRYNRTKHMMSYCVLRACVQAMSTCGTVVKPDRASLVPDTLRCLAAASERLLVHSFGYASVNMLGLAPGAFGPVRSVRSAQSVNMWTLSPVWVFQHAVHHADICVFNQTGCLQ